MPRTTHLIDATVVERSKIIESNVESASCIHRSLLKASRVLDETTVRKSDLIGTIVSSNKIRESFLGDCEVDQSVIIGTYCKGMVLLFGVWKKLGYWFTRLGIWNLVRLRKMRSQACWDVITLRDFIKIN
jgi:hypothetical protein